MITVEPIPARRLTVATNALVNALDDGRFPEDLPGLAREVISAIREYQKRVEAMVDSLTDEDKTPF